MINRLAGALILFVVLMQNSTCVFAGVPGADTDEAVVAYSDFLAAKSSAPIDYVLAKFQRNQVVSIGEVHENANSLDFLQAILKDERFIKEVGVLVWEFGSAQNQSVVDTALKAKKWDDKKLIAAYKQHTHPWGWPFRNYIDVYRTAWEINHSGKGQIRIINADVTVDWEHVKSQADYEKAVSKRDEYMAGIVENSVIKKGLKALFYAGEGHTNKLDSNKKRNTAGNLLLTKYPGKIFSLTLHKEADYDEKEKQSIRICDGLIDYAFDINGGSKPVAFDLNGSPFGQIGSECARFIPAGYRLQDMYDGYVYLGPLENYKRVDFIKDFYDAEYLKEVADRSKLVFGQDITEMCEIKDLSEFPAFFESYGRGAKKIQPLDTWRTKSEPSKR